MTDGADWDQSCPTPDPVAVTQQLAMAGIKTFVVGFSADGTIMPGGVGAGFLNDMACAGQTAVGFATNCKMSASGYVSVDPAGATLYLAAATTPPSIRRSTASPGSSAATASTDAERFRIWGRRRRPALPASGWGGGWC